MSSEFQAIGTESTSTKMETLETVESRIRNKMANRSGLPGRLGSWLGNNPEALVEIKVWMEMAKAGETEWPLARLYRELKTEYGFPYASTTMLSQYLRSNFPDEYPLRPNMSRAQ